MTDPDKLSEFESAELERDAERAAVLKKEELLAWCYERQAARREAEHQATLPKATASVTSRRAASQPFATDEVIQAVGIKLKELRAEIRAADECTIRAAMKAVAEVVVAEERARERECAGLRERVIALEAELAGLRQERGQRGLRAVPPSSPASLFA